ncbi:hypothetical protein U9M48_018525 [Paspalum notatum var. saurae]|uniref:DNL-type domain-containing protein n=1 Tax=Paspalum notatum var. saurae TaxID=547442 RepID=A0AAQ3TAW1_PASNO
MATTAAPCSCSPAAALLPFAASQRSLSSIRSPPPSRVSLSASSKPRTPAPRFRVSYRPRGLVVSACSSGEEATIDIKLPRRSLLVQFTCNACGERTKRLINRVAYERGTVFLQCAGCQVYHKFVDNLGLVVEYDLREENKLQEENAILVTRGIFFRRRPLFLVPSGHMLHSFSFGILGAILLVLEELDKALKCDIGVVAPHEHFCDVRRSHLHLLDQLLYLRVRGVVADGMVVGGEDSEGLWAAVPHVDVHVHPAGAEERRVEPLLVVGCEDDDPLLPTCRPEAVDEVEQPRQGDLGIIGFVGTILSFLCPLLQIYGAVDVLDDEDGSVGHPDEQPPKRGVPVHLSELEIVDVELEVVGHGRDEAGLAGPGRPIQQVPSLPRLADPLVVVLPPDEPLEVVHDGLLRPVVHGQRGEGGRVVEFDGEPGLALVHVDLERPVLLLDLLGDGEDVREVGRDGLLLVPPVEGHLEGADLESVAGAARAARAASAAASAAAARAEVVAADEAPPELGAVVDVGHLLAVLHAEHEALALGDAADAEALLHAGVDPGGQVRARRVVELVAGPTLRLLDHHRVVRRHARPQVAQTRGEQVPHLVGNQLVHHAAQQHRRRRQGRRRRHRLLVRLDGLVVGRHDDGGQRGIDGWMDG